MTEFEEKLIDKIKCIDLTLGVAAITLIAIFWQGCLR